jgi:fibronectin-binding autotransporter adhesin
MKTKIPLPNLKNGLLLCVVASLLALLSVARGAVIQKLDDANLLTDANAWTGAVAPGGADVALWDGTYSVTNAWALGVPASWAGISLGGTLAQSIFINDSANTLSLGGSGIDLSLAANSLTLNCPVTLAATQGWNVTNTRTLTVNGIINDGGGVYALTKTGAGTLALAGANTYNGPTTVSAGILQADLGTGLPAASALTLNGGTLASISGAITNGVGAGAGLVALPGGASGFSALGAVTTVSLGGPAAPTQLLWGDVNFNPTTLTLNGSGATADLRLANSIDLGAGNRTVSVATNTVTITGQITNSAASYQTFTKTGNGNLVLSNVVTFAATNINYHNNSAGTLHIIMPNQPTNLFGQIQQQMNTNGTLILSSSAGTTNYYYGTMNTYGPAIRNTDNGTLRLEGGTWMVPCLGQNNGGTQLRGTNYITNCTLLIMTNAIVQPNPTQMGNIFGLRYMVGNYFLQNGGRLIMSGGDRVEFGVGQTTSGQSYVIDLAEGSLMDIAVSAYGFRFGGGAGTTSTINQHGGNVQIGMRPGTQGTIKDLMVDYLGNTGTAIYNLSGGNLSVGGTISASASAAYFYFTGGILTANAFNTANFANMPDGTLVNNGGSLAPGGLGTAGKMTITGGYSNSAAATLAFDLGGTLPGNALTNAPGYHDFVSVSGPLALGGTLRVNLINGFTPAATNAFTILSASMITAGPENLVNNYNGYLPVAGAPGVYMQAVVNGTNLVLTNYGVVPPALAAHFTPTNAVGVAPFAVTFTDASVGAATNRHWNFGDGTTLNTLSTSVKHTFASVGNYTVTLTVMAADGTSNSLSGLVRATLPAANLTWRGDGINNNWNTTTANWLRGATPSAYADPDNATFDDTGFNTPAIALNFIAQPSSVTFNNSAKNYTLSGTGGIGSSGGVALNGSGTVTLLTTNTYTGATTISSVSTLQVGNGAISGSIDNSSAITNDGALILNQPDNHTLGGTITGSGSLTKAGAGTLALSADNSGFSGAITVNGGTLAAATDNSLGSGPVTLNNAGLSYQTLTGFTLSRALNLNGTQDSLNVNSTVTLVNNPNGNAAVTLGGSGTVVLDTGGASVSFPTNIHLNGGSIAYNRSDSFAQPGVISGGSAGSSIRNLGTAAGNTHTLTFADGTNVFGNIINGSLGDMILNGSAGSSNIVAGSLGLGYSNSVSLTINSGIYNVTNAQINGSLTTGPSTGTLTVNGGALISSFVNANSGGARFMRGNLTINGGAFRVTSGGLGFSQADGQMFTLNGGEVILDNSSGGGFYGLRLGGYNGAGLAGVSVTALQTGGLLVISNQAIDLGSSNASKVASYTLSGGSIKIMGGNAFLNIGASVDGTATTTFTMTNASLSVLGTIRGMQTNNTAMQVFSFQGGTLAAGGINATYLRDAAANPTGTFINSAGTLLPGDVGYPGRMTITGNFSNAPAATLGIEIGGTTAAYAAQENVNTNRYDNVAVVNTNASVVLDGRLNLSLINGFEPMAGASNEFVILSLNNGTNDMGAPSLTGTFANVSGGRVSLLGDPARTFAVSITPTNVVLSNYRTPSLQAYFTQNTNTGLAPLTVTFTNLSNGSGLTNLWNFGDGNTSSLTDPTVTHAYTSPGAYTVSLTVGNGSAVNTYTVSNAVVVTTAPKPRIGGIQLSGSNLTITSAGGTPNGGYTVLTSTNAVLPLAQWSTNSTGIFAADGSATNTIPVSAGTPSLFYILREP